MSNKTITTTIQDTVEEWLDADFDKARWRDRDDR